jgi:hypothetical protein
MEQNVDLLKMTCSTTKRSWDAHAIMNLWQHKKLALDKREWKLAIHVLKPWSSIPSFLLFSAKVFFPAPFHFFFLSVLLSFFLLSNWFLFLSFFIFSLLFWHCFIPICLTHIISSLSYPNLLRTKRLCCCCCWLKIHRLNQTKRPFTI